MQAFVPAKARAGGAAFAHETQIDCLAAATVPGRATRIVVVSS